MERFTVTSPESLGANLSGNWFFVLRVSPGELSKERSLWTGHAGRISNIPFQDIYKKLRIR